MHSKGPPQLEHALTWYLVSVKCLSGNCIHPHYGYKVEIIYIVARISSSRLPVTSNGAVFFYNVIGAQQACSHCHVESSPQRKEMATKEVAERCMEVSLSCHDNIDCRNLR